jgi:DNA polymerase-3 subunit epsilon
MKREGMIDHIVLKTQLSAPLSQLEFTAFDFETTGLYPDKDQIIEIGAVRFSLQKAGARLSTLIKPTVPVPPAATNVNGISDHMLAGKPSIRDVLPHFIRFIGESVLVAHNSAFDSGFLAYWLDACSLPSADNHTIDTMELAKQTVPNAGKYSLGHLCRVLELPVSSSHRALEDAQACRELFLYCVALLPGTGGVMLKDLYA